jgi:hypothetical protein
MLDAMMCAGGARQGSYSPPVAGAVEGPEKLEGPDMPLVGAGGCCCCCCCCSGGAGPAGRLPLPLFGGSSNGIAIAPRNSTGSVRS